MSLNPLSLVTLSAGTVLWTAALVGVVHGRGMIRWQRWTTAAILLAAPIGAVIILR